MISDTANKNELAIRMPYLRAIQALPGDTRTEKITWFMKLVSNQQQESGDVQQVPLELQPLLQVEIAVRERRHDAVANALQSEDITVVNSAMKASWFFDGSHENVSPLFVNQLLLRVPVNTRTRIVKMFACKLASARNKEKFAETLFRMVDNMFGVKTAYPLIIACDKEFIRNTMNVNNIVMPYRIVLRLFEKYPNFIISLLNSENYDTEQEHNISAKVFSMMLPKLLKERPEVFVELYEKYEILPNLSSACVDILLEKCMKNVIEKLHLYVNFIPPEKINNNLLEQIIQKLLPANWQDYNITRMLHFTSHYPEEKVYELLSTSYMKKYNRDILADQKNVIFDLVTLMPKERRVIQARLLLEKETLNENVPKNVTFDWFCFLPVKETIPVLKLQATTGTQFADRLTFVKKMILTCKLNEDDDKLMYVLTHFLENHKNEQFIVFEEVMKFFVNTYKEFELNEQHVLLLHSIVDAFYVRCRRTSEAIVETLLHFYFVHSTDVHINRAAQLIDMLLDINDEGQAYAKFDLLKDYPRFERTCLELYVTQMKERYSASNWQLIAKEEASHEMMIKNDNAQKKLVRVTLCQFVSAMHDSNDRCKQLISKGMLKKMTLDDHVWLKDAISAVMYCRDNFGYVTEKLYMREKDMRNTILSEGKVDVRTIVVFYLLKRKPQAIMDDWEYYLAQCKEHYDNRNVHHFLKQIRWYKDIPIKFVEACMGNLREKKDVRPALTILTFLLHGDTLMNEVIKPYVPMETVKEMLNRSDAKYNYKIVQDLMSVVKHSNPPIPLDFVTTLCEGDHMQLVLTPLTSLLRRSLPTKTIPIVRKMAEMRVSVKKHGIRHMNIIAPKQELRTFLLNLWSTEKNSSMRFVLFNVIRHRLITEGSVMAWSMFSMTLTTLRIDDKEIYTDLKLYTNFPHKYIGNYLTLWFNSIKSLELAGLNERDVIFCVIKYLESIESVYHYLPEEIIKSIFQDMLFNRSENVTVAARQFANLYLLQNNEPERISERVKLFSDSFVATLKKRVQSFTKEQTIREYNSRSINVNVYHLVKNFVIKYGQRHFPDSYDSSVFDQIMRAFLSIFMPAMNPYTYLLLMYAQLLDSNTINFGLKIGKHMAKLVITFSTQFVPIMTNVLLFFIDEVCKYSDTKVKCSSQMKIAVAYGLFESKDINSCFMAAHIISTIDRDSLSEEKLQQIQTLIDQLHQVNDVAITTILNVHHSYYSMY